MNRASEICYVSLEAVDSNGVLPMDMADDAHLTAYSFRKHMQRNLVESLATLPVYDSMTSVSRDLRVDNRVVESVFESSGIDMTPYEWIWRVAQGGEIGAEACYPLAIDHDVTPVKSKKGGRYAALIKLEKFIEDGLDRYDVGRNDVDDSASSGLSPWFHFGHLSTIEVVLNVLKRSNWNPGMISVEDTGKGSRNGWWGLSEAQESFLDQIITWRSWVTTLPILERII